MLIKKRDHRVASSFAFGTCRRSLPARGGVLRVRTIFCLGRQAPRSLLCWHGSFACPFSSCRQPFLALPGVIRSICGLPHNHIWQNQSIRLRKANPNIKSNRHGFRRYNGRQWRVSYEHRDGNSFGIVLSEEPHYYYHR